MKRARLLFVVISAAALLPFSCYRFTDYTDPGTTIDNPANLTLSGFTYTGEDTCHLSLSREPLGILNAVVSFYADVEPGTGDVEFGPFSVRDSVTGDDLWLLGACDTDGSGELSDGDMLMTGLRFAVLQGQDIVLPGLKFDASDSLTAGEFHGHNVVLSFGNNSTTPVSATQPLILRIDAGNPDFTDTTHKFKEFVFTDTTFSAVGIYSFPDIDADYFVLAYIDTDDDGVPDIGEPASSDSMITQVMAGWNSITAGIADADWAAYVEEGYYLQP